VPVAMWCTSLRFARGWCCGVCREVVVAALSAVWPPVCVVLCDLLICDVRGRDSCKSRGGV